MSNKQRQQQDRLWTSPIVRIARLGGLCVVAGAGLLAAGGLVAAEPSPERKWAAVALVALPALALGSLALHRASRSNRRHAH